MQGKEKGALILVIAAAKQRFSWDYSIEYNRKRMFSTGETLFNTIPLLEFKEI